jgi:hypothetical protein
MFNSVSIFTPNAFSIRRAIPPTTPRCLRPALQPHLSGTGSPWTATGLVCGGRMAALSATVELL